MEPIPARLRQCGKCAAPAAREVDDVLRAQDGSLFVCGVCGASLREPTKPSRLGRLVGAFGCAIPFGMCAAMGGLASLSEHLQRGSREEVLSELACTLIFSSGLIASGVYLLWPLIRLRRRWRLVEGGTVPLVDYRSAVPRATSVNTVTDRRCTCGKVVSCSKVSQERVRGLPIGKLYDYRCACTKRFRIEGASVLLVQALAAVFLSAAGGAIAVHPNAENHVFAAVPLLASCLYVGFFGWGLVKRILHPEAR